MSDEPMIELRNISKDYGNNIRALDDVCLSVNRGEIFGYLGANGAGKTTTIKILTGLLRPSSGNAFVGGRSILTDSLQVKAQIGYVPESGDLFEKLSPREYLTLTGNLHKLPDEQIGSQMDQWLRFFGLADRIDQRMEIFSKGTKQKICWIAAILHDPAVLILDEPLSGLDVEAISHTKELMSHFASIGKTVFYSSHLIDVVEKICTRIAVLKKGRLMHVGTVEEIRTLNDAPSLEQALMNLWQDSERL